MASYGQLQNMMDDLKLLIHHQRWPMAPDFGEKLVPLKYLLVKVQNKWMVPTKLGRQVAELWDVSTTKWGPEKLAWALSLREHVKHDNEAQEIARKFLWGLWKVREHEEGGMKLTDFISSLQISHPWDKPSMRELVALSFYITFDNDWRIVLLPKAEELFASATKAGVVYQHAFADDVDRKAFFRALRDMLGLPEHIWIWEPKRSPSCRCELTWSMTVEHGTLWVKAMLSAPFWHPLHTASETTRKEILQKRGLAARHVTELPPGYELTREEPRLQPTSDNYLQRQGKLIICLAK